MDAYSIPGVSEVRHRKEWKKPEDRKPLDKKVLAAVAAGVIILLIVVFLLSGL